jgi:hypothetical protein
MGKFEHLIVELKRPSVKLGSDEVLQIEKYALQIAEDIRFDKGKTKWIFKLIGNDYDSYVRGRINQAKSPV